MLINFYHLQSTPLDRALPQILETVLGRGLKAVVRAAGAQRVEQINGVLWSYAPESWLPHGSGDDPAPERQPVWLTDREENPNQAKVLVLLDGVEPAALAGYTRCLNFFDGNDDQAVAHARDQWKRWRDGGHELVYYQQIDGRWTEKARHTPPQDHA